MTKVADAAAKRAEQIANIHGFADWLAVHPKMPMPTLSMHRHLHSGDGTDVENLATVRRLAAGVGVDADESLDDRTVLRYRVNEHVWYELFTWHKDGRNAQDELERLRARVAELEADRTGLAYTRADDDTADPTPPGPRVAPHFESGTDERPVDETEPECPPECAQNWTRASDPLVHVDHCPKSRPGEIDPDSSMEAHYDAEADRPAKLMPSGLTPAADQSRGPLAGTTPVVTYFSFGHGQTDPQFGQRLLDHYVTVVAPTYDACREAMFASRFGRAWSFDYLAGTPRATEWIPRWTEHEVIVAPGTDPVLGEVALTAAADLLAGRAS